VFDIVQSQDAVSIENSYFNAGAYTPMVSRETSLDAELKSAESVTVNSSNYITTDEKLARHYLNKKIEIENMEFFAVLRTAKIFGVPARGIFIVTNYCNKKAHEDFLKNHQEAMRRLDAYVKSRAKQK
jgi:nucleoside phosphorylase